MAATTDRARRVLAHSPIAAPSTRLITLPMALAVLAVVVSALAALAAVRWTGGSPNPLNHLGYPGIILAAYLWGWRGALASAALTSFLLGPFGALIWTDGVEGPEAWAVRAAMFIMVGGVTGVLFTRMRHAMVGWQGSAAEVTESRRDAVVAMARGAEAKDADTGEHVLRVASGAEQLAVAAGLDIVSARSISLAALLHDVGKLHVPDSLLTKRGPLTEDEWVVMRQHTVWGERILSDGRGFELARQIARWHHENFDGSGYPDRIKGTTIPIEARIVRIADAVDAMTHDRPYKKGQPIAWAMQELERYAGVQFDPELARLYIDLLERHGLPGPWRPSAGQLAA